MDGMQKAAQSSDRYFYCQYFQIFDFSGFIKRRKSVAQMKRLVIDFVSSRFLILWQNNSVCLMAKSIFYFGSNTATCDL